MNHLLMTINISIAGHTRTRLFGKIHIGQSIYIIQGRGVHVTGVSAAYTFKLNKNILSE
jgi:hypothetical protein